jgi:hypothetical protein
VSVSISSVAFNGSTVDLSTEGTEDWISAPVVAPGAPPRVASPASPTAHKLLGGRMMLHFDWSPAAGTAFAQANAGMTRTSIAADTNTGAALNLTAGSGFFGSVSHYGFRLRARATPIARRLRIYATHFSAIMSVTARMDGSDTTATHDSGSLATAIRQWTIDFDSDLYSSELFVRVGLSTLHAPTPNLMFVAATLGSL